MNFMFYKHVPPVFGTVFVVFVLQVLAGSARLEEDAPAGRGTEGAGHLGRVLGRGSAQLHQPGLTQLRAHESESEGPQSIQL